MIIKYKNIDKISSKLKKKKKKIILCHGGFDFLHPGHLDHFKKAKSYGDILIVSTTGDNFFEKGLGRPFYNEKKRTVFLDAIKYVDYVTVVPYKHAKEVILKIKPDIYCKGKEYKDSNHPNKNIIDDINAVKKINSKIIYIGKNIQSSTKLISKKTNIKSSNKIILINDLISKFKKIKNKKILVIGETIFDKYNYVSIKGLTSKNTVISSEYIKSKTYYGGALKIFLNISNFVNKCDFLTIFNDDNSKYAKYLKKNKNIKALNNKNFINIEKIKYIRENRIDKQNIEIEKYFAVNKINNNFEYNNKNKEKILNFLKKNLNKYDLVVVADYGHGFIDQQISKYIQKYSKNLSVNCQTNSMNFGFNLITDKYQKCNNFVVDQKEITLTMKDKKMSHLLILKLLKNKLKSNSAFLTVGNKYSIGIDQNNIDKIPPLNKNLVDTIGAGDAYFSINSILYLSKLNLVEKNLLSQIAGGYACGFENNNYELTLDNFLKFYKTYF